MKYILILYVLANQGPTTLSEEFNNKDACETARVAVLSSASTEWGVWKVDAFCVAKGIDSNGRIN
jgi:hypothetical protein